MISTITLAAGVLLSLAVRERLSAAILALALTHVIQLNGMLQWWVRQTAEVENAMTSVERMLEYTELPQVGPWGGGPAPVGPWPWGRRGQGFDGALGALGSGAPMRGRLPCCLAAGARHRRREGTGAGGRRLARSGSVRCSRLCCERGDGTPKRPRVRLCGPSRTLTEQPHRSRRA